jgi:rod shape determining protein RodA
MSYGYGPAVLASRSTPSSSRINSGALVYLRSLDWVLVGSAVILSVVGGLLVWSATKSRMVSFGNDPQTFFKRHLINLGIGILLGFAASVINHRWLRAYTPILYGATLVGLILVLIPHIGSSINGARAWIVLPAGFSVEPAEFAKIGIILLCAMILSEKRDAETEPTNTTTAQALAIAVIPMFLIMLQPDLGTSLMIGFAVLGIVAVSGAGGKWLAGIAAVSGLATWVAVRFHLVKQYQLQRIGSFIDPNSNPKVTGYNTIQARIAIGSGGVFGKGLFHGPQTQGRFVPYNQTDFIYSVAGEELGLVGAAAIVVLIAVILWRGLRIAIRANDLFGRLVAIGIVCWLGVQAFENIGMNLGISPVTGVPLPFVSYGGTSMFASWIAIGLLLNVHRHSNA